MNTTKEYIDWIKVRRERRAMLVAVKQDDIERYLLVSKLPHVSYVDVLDMPEHWKVEGVQYDFKWNSFLFMVLSPEFESVPEGCQFQVIPGIRHVVKVTREIMEE